MSGPGVIIKSIYANMAEISSLASEICTVLESFRESSLGLDSEEVEKNNAILSNLFAQIESKVMESESLLRKVGMKSEKPFRELVSRLSGTSKLTFNNRLSDMEMAVNRAKDAIAHREVVLKTQMNILDEVVGEMQLEIHV